MSDHVSSIEPVAASTTTYTEPLLSLQLFPLTASQSDTTEYELPWQEAVFEGWDDTLFNGSFLSYSEGVLSTSSLEAVYLEGVDDLDSDDSIEDSENYNEDNHVYMMRDSYDSLSSETSGTLFAHPQQEHDAPPPWPITLSMGEQPGCSGWQLITERDPEMTFDEQVMQAYEESLRRVQEYWNKQALRPLPTPPLTMCPIDEKPVKKESFIMNAPPGLPKGKESSRTGKIKPKAKACSNPPVTVDTNTSLSLSPYKPPQLGVCPASYPKSHSEAASNITPSLPLQEGSQVHMHSRLQAEQQWGSISDGDHHS